MVDKKAAAGLALAVVGIGAAVMAVRGDEAPPENGEGAPEGDVSLEITSLGRPEGFSIDDVKGVWGVGASINVNGVATAGFPLPTMTLELYDNGSLRKSSVVPNVALNTTQTLSDVMGVADVGAHTVYGRMLLSNPLGTWEFTSDPQSFDIGEEPPGDVTLDVTVTPA